MITDEKIWRDLCTMALYKNHFKRFVSPASVLPFVGIWLWQNGDDDGSYAAGVRS